MSVPQTPIQVTHLVTDLITAGAQKALLRLLIHTDRDKFQPRVIALRNGDTPIAAQLIDLGIEVIDLQMLPKWRVGRLMRLAQELRTNRPDILHCWMIHSNIIGRLIGRMTRVPKIVVSRRSDKNGSRWATVLNRWLVNWSDGMIAVSESTKAAELAETGIDSARVTVVPNGIDASMFENKPSAADRQQLRDSLGYDNETILIGSVGRLTEAKGYPDLLNAFKTVSATLPQARLLIAGKGHLEAALKAQAKQLGIGERVQFPGVRSDIPQLLDALDLFAFSSHWEGMPNALMEAMAAGLPCVATAVSAAPELIDNGLHGILVPPKQPAKLAEAILKIANDGPLGDRLGQAAQQRILSEFTLANTAQKTVAVYEAVINTA